MQEKLIEILNEINKDISKYQGKDMIEDGVIDSLEIMEIATRIEMEFDIELDADDIVPEKFVTIEAIESLIKGK